MVLNRWVRLEGCLGVSDKGEGGFGFEFGSTSQVGRVDWFRELGRAADEVWGRERGRWVVHMLSVFFYFFYEVWGLMVSVSVLVGVLRGGITGFGGDSVRLESMRCWLESFD
eukprot:TRINITY_DN11179_c0_g2_i1.p1 TRINITY_DN11179_c0_g2~~TRINITY_DN11179_c0_g2_i1.p1  ORF type:complete len:112 (+),score=16.36 TRINITY_DN11179_c0_g2_i1:997-1332(+)